MTIILSVCSVGCNFLKSFNSPTDSIIAGEFIQIGNTDPDRAPSNTMSEAYSKVARASVAIKVVNGTEGGWGSGTIIEVDDDNDFNPNEHYIITCHHLVEGKGDITVCIPDEQGRNYTDENYDTDYTLTGKIGAQIYSNNAVTLVGGDIKTDVAVLKINTSLDIVEAKVAPQTGYSVGILEDVFAVGNPTGSLPGSVTRGNIAYINRQATFSFGTITCYQLNVDIWHGSSGGGLFNVYGELIGITNGGKDLDIENEVCNSGVNFSIPYKVSDNAIKDTGFVNIAKQLIGTKNKNPNNYGYVSGRKATIGFTLAEENDRVYISKVEEDSVAKKSGLAPNMIIEKVNGTSISSLSSFHNVFDSLTAGDTLTFTIKNGLLSQNITITIPQYRFCDTGIADPVNSQE